MLSRSIRTKATPFIMARRALSSQTGQSTAPLYASQRSLPHLPVPTLSSTLSKYSETLKPLLTPDELKQSMSKIQAFEKSELASKLQNRLEQRAKDKESWLSEWWNETAYMGYRGRIVPNVSYFYIHKQGLGGGKSQEERAAELVRGVVEFRKLVTSEQLEPEKVKGQPLCMASYVHLFNATRVPVTPADVPVSYPAAQNEHIVVLRKGRYYKVDTAGRGASELANAFAQVKQLADAQAEPAPIGVLTVDDRDVWTEARRHLLSLDAANTPALQAIESAIILVCLDDGPVPKSRDERSWAYWAGGLTPGADGKGRNRWFDKHQVIVDANGDTGFNGEHSLLDGTPTLRLNEFILAGLDKAKIPLELPQGEKATNPMPEIKEITFKLDHHLEDLIHKSAAGFAEEMAKQDLKVLHYTGYGKNAIKAHKASPDAWAQMVMQLAFFRLKQRPGVTYESAQTRKFLHGRTEVIRSASTEAKAWCEAMVASTATDAQRVALFRKAVTRHIQYSTWAADGQGVDRHLFGLKKLLQKGEETPEIFSDKAFAKSSHWELSTSQLGSAYLDGWGYGEVVEDGYGLAYSIGDDFLRWCITTMNGDAAQMHDALASAADELRALMDRAPKEEPVKAKL